MSYGDFTKTAYHGIRSRLGACRPASVRRKALLAWARYRHRPFVDSLPGIQQRVWIGPGEYFTHFYLTQRTFEPGVLAFLRGHVTPGMTVFDIGANVGVITLYCSGLVGPRGKVIAFEPCQRAYNRLLSNLSLNRLTNVAANQIALSDIDGVESYWEAIHLGEDVYNSLTAVKTPWAFTEDFRETRIQVHRLDTLMKQRGWPSPDLVKMDVEGAESKVLDGMCKTLEARRALTLVLECSRPLCEKFGYSIREFVEKLEHQGFCVRSIEETGELRSIDLSDDAWQGGMLAALR